MITSKQLEDLNFMTWGQKEYIDEEEWFMFCVRSQSLYSWSVYDGRVELIGKYTDVDLFKEAMYLLSAPYNEKYK
jgi:hypothetical protein